MKKIFLLDMDDTLLDFQRAEYENVKKTLAQFGVCADDEMIGRFHAINDGLWKALERGETTRERLKVQRFRLLFEEYGLERDADAAADAYWNNFPEICFPFEGVYAFLSELKARGRVYIVTNGGAVIQRRHIELAGFSPFIDGLFISELMGVDKPSPAFADYVASHIGGYKREEAVWIGDSPTSDLLCARAGGIDFILFQPRGGEKREDCPCASSYDGLIKEIDKYN